MVCVCPKCGEKNPSWHINCANCKSLLRKPSSPLSSLFLLQEAPLATLFKLNSIQSETFEKISLVICVVLLASVIPAIFVINQRIDWKILFWFAGFFIYYRALYEVYLSYVVRNDVNSIWFLFVAGMATGFLGGLVIVSLWDIIRFGLRIIFRQDKHKINFFWIKAFSDTAIH